MVLLLIIFCFVFSKPIFAADPVIKITDFSSDSSPSEWIQLTNTTSENITLTDWYFIDDSNTKKNITNSCLSSLSNQTFEFSGTWLNNTGDSISLYNSTGTLIDKLVYSDNESKNQNLPSNTNTCVIPVPTTDPNLIINPTSGISITEFMPYTSFEWVEIFNNNDSSVKLNGWSLEDNSGKIYDLTDFTLTSKQYKVIDLKSYTLNDNGDSITLKDSNGQKITTYSYGDKHYKTDQSWSFIFGSWCQASITSGSTNSTSCFVEVTPTFTPTPTKTPSPIPTVDLNRFDATNSATPSVINEPVPQNSHPSPSPSPSVLGDSTTDHQNHGFKKNFLPLILIFGGGLLLTSPLIISKFKKNEKDT